MADLAAAISFLTLLPVSRKARSSEEMVRAVPWFPVVGAGVGLIGGAVFSAALTIFPPLIAGALAVTATVIVTGALHEDGLSDTADALGGCNSERRLEIMKDSRIGTYGAAALVLSIIIRVVAVSTLAAWEGVAALVAAHSSSRAGAVVLMRSTGYARDEGLGASFATGLSRDRVLVSGVIAIIIGSAMLGPWMAIVVVAVAATSTLVGVGARKLFGGLTGDVLGAAQQLGELASLLVVVGAIEAGAGIPWWA